jgi:hypothetical protein
VNEFVEQCRQEWRRLHVPEPVASEMAADLAADLEEAEAEGVSPEEVLGHGAHDPRSFAAAWAAERGVGREPAPPAREPRSPFVLAAVAGLVAIAVSGAAVAVLASPSVTPLEPPRVFAPSTAERRVIIAPDGAVSPDGLWIARAELRPDVSGVDARAMGVVLVVAGLVGAALVTLLWLWLGPRRQPRVPAT